MKVFAKNATKLQKLRIFWWDLVRIWKYSIFWKFFYHLVCWTDISVETFSKLSVFYILWVHVVFTSKEIKWKVNFLLAKMSRHLNLRSWLKFSTVRHFLSWIFRIAYCICLNRKTPCICRYSQPFSRQRFRNIEEFETKTLRERQADRVKLCFFVTFNTIIRHVFSENVIEISLVGKKIWIFSPSITTNFSNFSDFFLQFLVAKKLITSAYNRWCQDFFTFNLL